MKGNRFSNYLLIAFVLLSIFKVNAQYGYGTSFIIADKDGYTNVREEPNAKSKIVGQFNKYEVFSSIEGCEDIDVSPSSIHWLQVEGYNSNGKYVGGYIFKKNIYPLDKLPGLDRDKDDNDHSIAYRNDSIQVVIDITSCDSIATLIKESKEISYEGISYDDTSPQRMLNKIIINYNDVQTIINKEQLKSYYCELAGGGVWVGFDGELYIALTGSGDEAFYYAWLTIVAGKLANEYVITSCW
jgi:hypothetical protein